MKWLYEFLFQRPLFLTLVLTIIVSNNIIALAVVQYHNRIWFNADSEPPSVVDE